MDSSRKSLKKSDGKNRRADVETSFAQVVSYSGPLPPASELAKYNEIAPDIVERILTMAEKEQQQAHKVDSRDSLSTSIALILMSSVFLALPIGLVIVAIICATKGMQVVSAVSAISAVVTAFPRIIDAIRKR
jgi:uncharacterized membrane protein